MVKRGDLVAYADHIWDVVGSHILDEPESDGTVPMRLRLERTYRSSGRKQTYRTFADSREVTVIGQQSVLWDEEER